MSDILDDICKFKFLAEPVHPDEDSGEGVDLLAEEGDSPDEDEAVGEDPISEEDTETEDEEGDTEEDPKSFESDVVEDSELADEQDGSVGTSDARVLAVHVIIIESVIKRSDGAVDESVPTSQVVPANDELYIASDSTSVENANFALRANVLLSENVLASVTKASFAGAFFTKFATAHDSRVDQFTGMK
eukprot:gene2935-1182_t